MEYKPTKLPVSKLPVSNLRLAAEKKISEESKVSAATHAVSHEDEILQELRVHQLELEMQNAELFPDGGAFAKHWQVTNYHLQQFHKWIL